MQTWRVASVLALLLCVVTGGGCKKALQKRFFVVQTDMQEEECGPICAQETTEEEELTACCPVGSICCTPGSLASKCCPEGHPVCTESGCCSEEHPKQCGDQYCCTEDSYCCNGEACCESEDECCGDSCCQQEACCTGPDDEKTCCNEDEMACCGSEIGCVDPCPCPFDAIGCESALPLVEEESTEADLLTAPRRPVFDCPNPRETKKLYRTLRADESCKVGLIAKNPSQNRTFNSHVFCGSRRNYQSQFISTTSSIEVANYWKARGPTAKIAVIGFPPNPRQCIVIDLTTTANRNLYLKGNVSKAYAKRSCEVLLSCGDFPVPCTYAGADAGYTGARDASEL